MMLRFIIFVFAFLLSACASAPTFERTAIHYNNVVADANNEQILLNIVRGSKRQPMYFTGFTQLSGKISYGFSTEIGLSDNDEVVETTTTGTGTTTKITEALTNIAPKLSANVSSEPAFEFQVLDGQDFYTGITQPVSEDLILNYLRQGWPSDLLAAVMIERVEFRDEETQNLLGEVNNDPSDHVFGRLLQCLSMDVSEKPSVEYSPKNMSDELDIIVKSESILDGSISLSFSNPGEARNGIQPVLTYQAKPRIGLFRFNHRVNGSIETLACHTSISNSLHMLNMQNRSNSNITLGYIYDDNSEIKLTWNKNSANTTEQKTRNIETTIVTRSIQGMIYFLGEYARTANYDSDCFNVYCIATGRNDELTPTHLSSVINVTNFETPQTTISSELDGIQYYLSEPCVANAQQVNRAVDRSIYSPAKYAEKGKEQSEAGAASKGKGPTLDVKCNIGENSGTLDQYRASIMPLLVQILNLQKTADERPISPSVRVR